MNYPPTRAPNRWKFTTSRLLVTPVEPSRCLSPRLNWSCVAERLRDSTRLWQPLPPAQRPQPLMGFASDSNKPSVAGGVHARIAIRPVEEEHHTSKEKCRRDARDGRYDMAKSINEFFYLFTDGRTWRFIADDRLPPAAASKRDDWLLFLLLLLFDW